MNNRYLSALDIYMNRVFKILIIAIPIVAIFAGVTFSTLKLLGMYPEVPWIALLAFDLTHIIYLFIGIVFFKNCEDADGNLKSKTVLYGKIYIAVMEFVQWNFISYMIPSHEFWAYAFLFAAITAFFLDSRFVAVVVSELAVSIAVSWVIRGEYLLPSHDGFFEADMVLRIVLLCFSLFAIWAFTYLVEKLFVRELEKIADIDTLTLLLNRRSLNTTLDEAVNGTVNHGRLFSVLMCDIDDFKAVNDRYGHTCGDLVLKHVASEITTTLNGEGKVFRYGGEEFLVVLEYDVNLSFDVGENIRENILNSAIIYDGNEISVTVTIGVAEYQIGDLNGENTIRRADTNLYYGKSHGKNHGKNLVIK